MRRAFLFAAASVTIAGCGSSSLSDHDLRADATAICSQANQRLGRIRQPSSATAALPFLRRGSAVLGPELASLRQLAPPADLANRYHATVAELSTAVSRIRATIVLLTSGGDPVGAFDALEQQLAPIVVSESTGWRTLQIAACVSR